MTARAVSPFRGVQDGMEEQSLRRLPRARRDWAARREIFSVARKGWVSLWKWDSVELGS